MAVVFSIIEINYMLLKVSLLHNLICPFHNCHNSTKRLAPDARRPIEVLSWENVCFMCISQIGKLFAVFLVFSINLYFT